MIELKNDIANYRKRLTDQQDSARQMEKSEGKLVQELMEQNERLTTQLKQVGHLFGIDFLFGAMICCSQVIIRQLMRRLDERIRQDDQTR